MVPGRCTVRLKDAETVTYDGTIAHASTPENGVNAISAAMEALAVQMKEAGERDRFVEFFNQLIGWELDGASLGLAFEDETGETTVNAGLLTIDDDQAVLSLNVRYPVSLDFDYVMKSLIELLEPYGVTATQIGRASCRVRV